MVESMLCAALSGRLLEMPNPMDFEGLSIWTGEVTDVSTMRTTLNKEHFKDRFYLEARQRGGLADTQRRQRLAPRTGLRLGRQRTSGVPEKALQTSRLVLQMVSDGVPEREMATRLGIAPISLQKTITRARERLLPVDSELAKAHKPEASPGIGEERRLSRKRNWQRLTSSGEPRVVRRCPPWPLPSDRCRSGYRSSAPWWWQSWPAPSRCNSRSARAIANLEADLLEKLDLESQAAKDLPEVIEARISKWHGRFYKTEETSTGEGREVERSPFRTALI